MAGAHHAMKNPFAQSPVYQLLTIIAPQGVQPLLEIALEELAISVAHFEHIATDQSSKVTGTGSRSDYANYYEGSLQSEAELWKTDIVVADAQARAEAEMRLELLSKSGTKIIEWHWQDLQMRDWVSEIQSQFPPLSVGRFYIHGSHIERPQPPKIGLRIDAGCAFGTGEHATTSGCLRALEFVARQRRFHKVLDLGCGTGILAIAAQKLWPQADICGSDMDAVAVKVAKANGRDNAAKRIRFYTAPGFKRRELQQSYDLIFANILARPLIFLAGEIDQHLKPGGVAILSGLLHFQELDVLAAYRCRGLKLVKAFRQQDWSALVLVKPGSGAA